MRVLIVEDGLGSYVLPAARSLGAAGWTVGLGGPRDSRAAASRWVSATHVVPPAEQDLGAFAEAVQQAVRGGSYDVVFGGDDVEVLALSATRDQLGAAFPYAPHDVVMRAVDKLHLVRAAEAVGLGAPRTVADDGDLAEITLPAVVKARLHWAPGSPAGKGRHPARTCSTTAELEQALAAMASSGTPAVVQEAVDGRLVAVTALCSDGGRVVAESHQVSTRTSPTMRNSTRAHTVRPDEELSRAVGRLLRELGWFGIANLQFLRSADGRPQLIDLNGRFYGSLTLAVRAGLDLPRLWAEMALDRPAPTAPACLRGRPGVRYSALEEDLRRARVERRRGLLADCAATVGYAFGAAHSTWDVRDLRPARTRVAHLGTDALRRRLPRASAARLLPG